MILSSLFTIVWTPALTIAYIGPGMGAGLIATILGIVGSFFLALFGILYYSIKRYLKNRKKKQKKD